MERIRVLRIIARMNVGGPAVQISGLMRGLDPEVFDQRLLTGFCAEDEQDFIETQATDVTVTRIRGLGRAINAQDDARAIPELIKQIREFKPHIIHTHTAKAGVLGRVAAKVARSDAKLVHTFHGHLLHGYFSPRKTRIVTMIEKALAARTDALIAVGPQVRDDLLAVGIGKPDQYEIIPPGLELGPIPERALARELLNEVGTKLLVSMIGRITKIKRPDRFADVAAIIKESHPEVRFLVAGSGDEEQALAARVTIEQLPISLLGWRSDIATILAASNLLVLTSDNEGTPLSLIQASMAGIPVVATNVGSVKDVVSDGVTGILCPPEPQAIAKAIQKLIDNPEQAIEMGANAKKFAEDRFGVARLVHDHETLYTELLS